MIPPEAGQTIFRLAVFVTVLAALVLLWGQPSPGTAGFVMSVAMLVFGLAFAALVLVLARISQRRRR